MCIFSDIYVSRVRGRTGSCANRAQDGKRGDRSNLSKVPIEI